MSGDSDLMSNGKNIPRITFGIIVLNGEPFTRYNLRALYPFAYEIIIVEGAVTKASAVATSDGHSTDGTLELLHQFKAAEDPENKIQIVTRNGFWKEKDEQSQAYAERATGDYLWQIDIDEFYKAEDMEAILLFLQEEPSVDGIGFNLINFWGSFDTVVDSWEVRYLQRRWGGFPRLFRWGEGFKYVTHRPPTVYNKDGQNLRNGNWTTGANMAKRGIFCYHYSMVFEMQARQKIMYYPRMWEDHSDMKDWYENVFINVDRPFHIMQGTKLPGWLKKYKGNHPEQIHLLQEKLGETGEVFKQGNREAMARLLSSNWYHLGCFFLSLTEPIPYYYEWVMLRVRAAPGFVRKKWRALLSGNKAPRII